MEGYLLYPGLCTWFHRMVTANGPSPDTYILVFISAGSLYKFLYFFLSSRSSVQIQIEIHIVEYIIAIILQYHITKVQTPLLYIIVHMLILEILFSLRRVYMKMKIVLRC